MMAIEKTKTRVLSTVKKDEAAFYLNELARGLLRDRVYIRAGGQSLIFDTFETMHLELTASERRRQYAVEIRLKWQKPACGGAAGPSTPDSAAPNADADRRRSEDDDPTRSEFSLQ